MFFILFFFFFNDTATTEIYTLSLHDALPICILVRLRRILEDADDLNKQMALQTGGDRKSTRLNSSHVEISYAVFCLKKKKEKKYSLGRMSMHSRSNRAS